MSHKRHLPLGLLAAVLLVALATIGVVNGLWSKNLVVNGTVTMGDLNVDWTDPGCAEYNPWPLKTVQAEYLGKNVGWLEWQIGDPVYGDQVMNLTLHNTYPSYFVDCEIHWVNNGSIPVNFAGAVIVPSADLTNCVTTVINFSSTVACDELTIVFIDGQGQVDPCPFLPTNPLFATCLAAHSLLVHTEQKAAQSDCTATGWALPQVFDAAGNVISGFNPVCTRTQSYHFKLKLCVAQWNEAATYADCIGSLQHEGPP